MINLDCVSKTMDKMLEQLDSRPKLLLQCCCAPCSSYVLEYLSPFFEIYAFYYNPNITEKSEYEKRKLELSQLIDQVGYDGHVHMVDVKYNPEEYSQRIHGYEQEPERGARCTICFTMRLEEAARKAKEMDCDYFATTLTISPMKNDHLINKIGLELGEKMGIDYLPSNFKKKGGYQRSIVLSREYHLYRQDYCGCIYSKVERAKEKVNVVKE